MRPPISRSCVVNLFPPLLMLDSQEIETLCREWQPEPLVPTVSDDDMPVERVITE